MQIGSIIAVYFIVWWLTFVMVLPIGSQSHHEAGTEVVAGGDPASPINPRLVRKLLLATGLSVVFTALLLWGLANETLQHYWNR
jgi:predicted secreted protein